jgi:hypothetical protein
MTAPLRIGRLPMMRISLSYIYDLAGSLEPLERLPEVVTPWSEIWLPCIMAQTALENLHINSPYAPFLRASGVLANTLNEQLKKEINDPDNNRSIPIFALWSLRDAFRKYKIVLQADLSVLHSYFVTQKGGYDTLSLLAFGEYLFPPELVSKVPEAIFDGREAGKCLAYEMPTACGFHVFRAMESVLRKYYASVTGGKGQKHRRLFECDETKEGRG